jgi:hypothetical protein
MGWRNFPGDVWGGTRIARIANALEHDFRGHRLRQNRLGAQQVSRSQNTGTQRSSCYDNFQLTPLLPHSANGFQPFSFGHFQMGNEQVDGMPAGLR